MALAQSALLEVLEGLQLADASDRIRGAAQTLYQALIDAEAQAVIGAAPYERSPERVAQRNGSRPRTLTTTAGDLELRIPKLRTGSFFGSLLERRRRVDQALFAVVIGGLKSAACRPGRSTTWSRRWAATRGSASPRSGGSARRWTRMSRRLETGRWAGAPTRTCSSTRRTARRASAGGWSPRPWSSRSASPPMGAGKSSASMLGTARLRRFGPRSCGRCAPGAWMG
jgi:hypothetical protein